MELRGLRGEVWRSLRRPQKGSQICFGLPYHLCDEAVRIDHNCVRDLKDVLRAACYYDYHFDRPDSLSPQLLAFRGALTTQARYLQRGDHYHSCRPTHARLRSQHLTYGP